MTLRAHEQPEHSNEARQRRPRTGSTAATGATDVGRILALQRTAGNAAVASVLSGRTVQRADAAAAGGGGQAGNRGSVPDRERALSARYGIRIGPAPGQGGEHFNHALLDRIDSALRQLPPEDLGPNQNLLAIEMDPDPEGAASLYNSETRSIRIVRPPLAGALRVPALLYANLNRGSNWQRAQMNQGALAEYGGISPAGDRALGIPGGARQVMGMQGNLVKWIIRHEVGHAVDEMTGWERNLAGEERFGGWQSHSAPQEREAVAGAILRAARLDAVLPSSEGSHLPGTLAFLIRPDTVRDSLERNEWDPFFALFERHLPPPEFAARKAAALHFLRLAVAHPWTLDSGGADILDVNGRTYQLDQYDTWVSYSSAQRRQYRVSNYQFSTPVEWFAEAYATYYDQKRLSERAKIHPQAQAWFATLPRPAPAGNQAAAGPAPLS